MKVEDGDRSWRTGLRSVVYLLSFVILFTSMIDLFVNRLLFRAGPEVLGHVQLIDVGNLAAVGRISLTLEQLALFVTIGSAMFLLLGERSLLPKLLGALLIPILACSALLYAPLPASEPWVVSAMLIIATATTISGLGVLRALGRFKGLLRRQQLSLGAFLIFLLLSFLFPFYYRMYLILGTVISTPLPFGIVAYQAGIYSVMATTFAFFLYALSAPSPGFTLNYRNFVKVALLPTLLVAPVLYGLVTSFFITQIFTMVIVMSTDLALSLSFVRVLVLLYWFLLTAILILLVKGHYSTNKLLLQEAIGLVFIASAAFLFNYPHYVMLGTAGVLLFSYPLIASQAGIGSSSWKRNVAQDPNL
jgi:hypothetical protein